jgi:hypothetical protein
MQPPSIAVKAIAPGTCADSCTRVAAALLEAQGTTEHVDELYHERSYTANMQNNIAAEVHSWRASKRHWTYATPADCWSAQRR